MTSDRFPIDRETWGRFVANVRLFTSSTWAGRKAKALFLLLIGFSLGINGLNVVNSFVGRNFMTAIADRNHAEFLLQALFYISVFALSTVVAVFYRYTEEHLGLLWREWAARRSIISYGNHRVYYRLKIKGEIGNPDQRIADDIRTYAVTTISFLLMLLNGSFTVLAFSGVLWSISPLLFGVSVLYAAAGTYLTLIFGKPLVRLNYDQLDKEANFRSSLTYLRANAESVALSRREGHLIQLSLKNLSNLVANFRHIISINRNVNFFTTGYNWMIQIIPALIVAPLFIEGKVEFGVVTQSAMAFTQLLGAFSLIVTQFQSISSYAAVLARLVSFVEASDREKAAELSINGSLTDESRVIYDNLVLCSPRSGRTLINELSHTIAPGNHLLVLGKDKTARTSLFRATAGLWKPDSGRIIRPKLNQILFISEMPFLPPGTLRELLMKPWPEKTRLSECNLEEIEIPEERIMETLRLLKIDTLVAGAGGLDKREYWENTLPLTDQQLLVIARLLIAAPAFAFLDRPSTVFSSEQLHEVLTLLDERSITYVTFEESSDDREHYAEVIELIGDGTWSCRPVERKESTRGSLLLVHSH
ncbi:MAG TPA: SbmA/BacA-like family transporter [Thermodesulfobacteriota bacterium]|nr:ABC transporter ATP-binding protein/permease [Deltaproteobacteria bacterium]HNR11989.1 SbmA/BacA-like family transporter [Thermodesulfobacteriota bacterium]HNU71248.1 SbmA/BacA-like family transporter [Thermodesulfobacteriota bacterium]HOC37839.1 SbmA/BacA-like family transporter [Thermodesulfobacteriota bacterium]HQO77146.1 SbmA/BacA-like family transporter [Thermodesulfobacteriota bacterium]